MTNRRAYYNIQITERNCAEMTIHVIAEKREQYICWNVLGLSDRRPRMFTAESRENGKNGEGKRGERREGK